MLQAHFVPWNRFLNVPSPRVFLLVWVVMREVSGPDRTLARWGLDLDKVDRYHGSFSQSLGKL